MAGITRYPVSASVIQPTKPQIANLNQATVVQNTWYTVVDTSGKGVLSKVILSATEMNYRYSIRVTIDGVAVTVTDATGALGLESLGLAHNPFDANNYNAERSIDYYCNSYFKTSLKVEVANTVGIDAFKASVMYSLT